MLADIQVHQGIQIFSMSISQQPIGLALHRPEAWASPTMCFGNASKKAGSDGGRVVVGWMFHYRVPAHLRHTGYLVANHHAVWCDTKGHLFDVTPFHDDPKHHPIVQADGVIFLVDDNAQPVIITNHIAPLPMRFFPLTDDPQLAEHVEGLRAKEIAHCSNLYDRIRDKSGA